MLHNLLILMKLQHIHLLLKLNMYIHSNKIKLKCLKKISKKKK